MDVAGHVRKTVDYQIRKIAAWDGKPIPLDCIRSQVEDRINRMSNTELLERIGEALSELMNPNREP